MLAAAISIGTQTNLARLLSGQQEGDFAKALGSRQFYIDPSTMRIFIKDDER